MKTLQGTLAQHFQENKTETGKWTHQMVNISEIINDDESGLETMVLKQAVNHTDYKLHEDDDSFLDIMDHEETKLLNLFNTETVSSLYQQITENWYLMPTPAGIMQFRSNNNDLFTIMISDHHIYITMFRSGQY